MDKPRCDVCANVSLPSPIPAETRPAFPLGLLWCFVLCRVAALATHDAPRPFDVPADSADKSLKRFSEQAGLEVIFSTRLTRDVKTKLVKGAMTARQALDAMLADTGLVVIRDEKTGAFTVSRGANGNRIVPEVAPKTAADRPSRPSRSSAGPATDSQPTQKKTENMKTSKNPIAVLAVWLALVFSPAQAQPEGTGTIEGRVLNASNGQYLKNARVTVQGTSLESITNEFGEYRLAHVPSGTASVRAAYVGLDVVTQSVTVGPGQRVRQDFSVGDVVQLDSFIVTSSRETNAANIAINEQRFAANVKNVVAADAFGDVTEGNVGEFMKYLPGVTVDYVAGDVRTISVRGLGANFTGVTFDGARLASAASAARDRVFELEQVSINNVSRVEVTKVPTPEMPADSLGGSVNLVSKSAFESARTQFKYRAYLSMNSAETQLFKKTPGPTDEDSFKVLPGFDFNYIAPLTADFGIVLNGLTSNQFNAQNEQRSTWQFTGGPATPAAPYLRRYSYQPGPKNSYRDSLSAQADWRPAKDHVISVGAQFNYYHAFFDDRALGFDVGSTNVPTPATGVPLTFGPTFTHGATGRGVVSLTAFTFDKYGLMTAGNVAHRYKGRTWELDSGLNVSKSRSWYRDTGNGHFFDVQAALPSVSRVLYDGIKESFGYKITALNAAGNPIDYGKLSNYTLTGATTGPRDGMDKFKAGRINVKRRLDFLPFEASLKVGGMVQQQDRDTNRQDSTLTFVGPDGLPNTADDNAGLYLDPKSVNEPTKFNFGIPTLQYPDLYRLWQVFQNQPGYFQRTTAQAVSAETSRINNSFALTEKITAAYVQAEARLWKNRLRILTGVRYEKTADNGVGPQFDPSGVFQRGANGRLLTDSGGAPIRKPEAGAVGSLAELALIRKARATTTDRSYDGYYPSMHLTFSVTEELLLRAAYARTFGRPNLGNILPNTTINESANPTPGAPPGTITVVNGGLLPYTAKNYDLSLEYYFPKGGLISVGGFRKDLTKFFGALNTLATTALLTELGLDPRYVDWTLRSTINVADPARVTGVEFNYNQPLTFLPYGGKYFNFTANVTQLHLQGPRATDFNGFIPKAANLGLTFSKKPVVLMLKWNHRGRQRQSSSGAAPNAFQYLDSWAKIDINVEYQITRNVTAFVNARNPFEVVHYNEIYSPETPAYSHRFHYGGFEAQYAFGVKGSF